MTTERTETEEEDANQSSDNRGFGFSLSKMFGLGHWQSAEEDGQTSASINDEDQESQERGQEDYGTKWNIQDMDAAGMDSSILSKLALVQQVRNLFTFQLIVCSSSLCSSQRCCRTILYPNQDRHYHRHYNDHLLYVSRMI